MNKKIIICFTLISSTLHSQPEVDLIQTSPPFQDLIQHFNTTELHELISGVLRDTSKLDAIYQEFPKAKLMRKTELGLQFAVLGPNMLIHKEKAEGQIKYGRKIIAKLLPLVTQYPEMTLKLRDLDTRLQTIYKNLDTLFVPLTLDSVTKKLSAVFKQGKETLDMVHAYPPFNTLFNNLASNPKVMSPKAKKTAQKTLNTLISNKKGLVGKLYSEPMPALVPLPTAKEKEKEKAPASTGGEAGAA